MTSPVVLTRRSELVEFVNAEKRAGRGVGFVPTMGALHSGHGHLLTTSVANNPVTVLSLFVNPKQFGPQEDFSRYPRSFSNDVALAAEAGVSAVFAPSVQEMYPDGFVTHVHVGGGLGEVLCGQFRPGHFDGVSTVVLLLLNLVQADVAYFGTKDFQQLTIIRRLCRDLAHPTRIEGVPTVREADGLALSSRNRYLDAALRARAAVIPRALARASRLFLSGERDAAALVAAAQEEFGAEGLTPQYLELRQCDTLLPVQGTLAGEGVLAVALPLVSEGAAGGGGATVGARLIDNVVLSEEPGYLQVLEDLVARARGDARNAN